MAHEADVDGELVAQGGEFAGAVERVDEPVIMIDVGGDAGLHLLLGDDGDVRCGGAQAGDDYGFGGVVGQGDRAAIGLAEGLEAAGADLQDDGAGLLREVRREFEQRGIVHPPV